MSSPLKPHLRTVSADATEAAYALGAASFGAIDVFIAHVVGSRAIVHCSVMHIPYGGRKGWWSAMNPNSDVVINIVGLSSALSSLI